MINRMSVAALLFASGALVGGCATGPMTSLDPVPSLAVPAAEPGLGFPELRGLAPEHAPMSAGDTLQTP